MITEVTLQQAIDMRVPFNILYKQGDNIKHIECKTNSEGESKYRSTSTSNWYTLNENTLRNIPYKVFLLDEC